MYSYQFKEATPFSFQIISFKDYLSSWYEYLYFGKQMPPISQSTSNALSTVFAKWNLNLSFVSTPTFIDHSSWWYKMDPLTAEDMNFYLPWLALEFSLYPKTFIERLGIKQIIVCNSWTYHSKSYEQYRAAIPDYDNTTRAMVYCAKERNIHYIRSVIHHEFFHYYDYVHSGAFFSWRDDLWEMNNQVGFNYGKGGWLHKDYDELDYGMSKCFVSEYATSAIEEDKAETYCWMVTKGIDMAKWTEREGVLGKCLIIKNKMESFDPTGFYIGGMDFWERVARFKKEFCDVYYGKDE